MCEIDIIKNLSKELNIEGKMINCLEMKDAESYYSDCVESSANYISEFDVNTPMELQEQLIARFGGSDKMKEMVKAIVVGCFKERNCENNNDAIKEKIYNF